MQLHSAQFPEERTVFRKANGVTKTLSVVIRKTYEVETGFLPEAWHQRLTIALGHDNIQWEGDRFLGGVAKDGEYNIQWPEGVLHYPTAKAECKVQVTPFDATNSNCQTCEEASQLDLQDDTVTGIYGELQEDTDYTWPLEENDTICCYPAVFSLVSFNSTYLTSASVNADTGLLTIHTGVDLVSAVGILIATYRVTCPNGGYDEANVYASFEGSVVGCLAPTELNVSNISPDSATASWTETEPGSTYYWELYEGTGPIGSPVQTGTVTDDQVDLTGLDADTEYFFQVRTVCYGSNSDFVTYQFDTVPESGLCGEYEVAYDNGSGVPSEVLMVQYRDCSLAIQFVLVHNTSSVIICAGQYSPGSPVAISGGSAGAGTMTTTYLGLC